MSLDPNNPLGTYVLDAAGEPRAEPDSWKWALWFEASRLQRRVGVDDIMGWRISTIFLGLDHNSGCAPPILWETMVFAVDKPAGADLYRPPDRCSGSREQALAMHQAMVAEVKAQLADGKISHP